MAPLQITCTGESTIAATAERAIVFLTISSSGLSQPEVSKAVTKTSNAVSIRLKTMALTDPVTGQAHPDAPITSWSMSSLYTGSSQPIDRDRDRNEENSKPLPRAFTAATKLQVTFRDFASLGSFSSDLASTDLVSVEHIEWTLTDATKAELGRQCRRNAVKDAMMKAKDYADAVGKEDFEILEITDGDAPSGYVVRGAYRGRREEGEDEELRFEPEDVSVSAMVTARFDAA